MLAMTEDSLKVLKGKPNSGVLSIPLVNIRNAEGRIPEIAAMTPHKAGELLSLFNSVFLEIGGYSKSVELELNLAKQNFNVVKATVLLDKAEDIFKAKGIKPSADLRQALVDSDPDCQVALQRVSALEAANEYLKMKQKGIEMAYGSVRKMLGETVFSHRNTNLNGTMPSEEITPF